MIAAGQLALQRNFWTNTDAIRQKKLIQKAGLPTKWPDLKIQDVLRVLQGDKKVKDGKIRFIIPKGIGKVEIYDDINENEIYECLTNINRSI